MPTPVEWWEEFTSLGSTSVCLYDPGTDCPGDPSLCCLVSPNWEAVYGSFDPGDDPF